MQTYGLVNSALLLEFRYWRFTLYFISMEEAMTATGIVIPEAVTTALWTQVTGVIASLTSWLPAILIAVIGIPAVLFLFRLVKNWLFKGVKGR